MEPPSKGDVRATYERIAHSFAQTRREPWPEVVAFIDALPARGRVLDLGCGNGRHMRALASRGHVPVGVDFSPALLALGRRDLDADWVGGDATVLPFRDATMDACLCAAVLHHLPTPEARLETLREVRRVLVPGGTAFVTVWARDQPRFADEGQTAAAQGDTFVPFTLPDGVRVPRYYHLFTTEEFRALIIESGLHGESFLTGRGNLFGRASKHG